MNPTLRLLFVITCAVVAALFTLQLAVLLLAGLPSAFHLLLGAVYGLAGFLAAALVTEGGRRP